MTAALEGGDWSAGRPSRTLPPGKTRYPLYRRLGGPQGRSGWVENRVPTRIRSQTVQPVVSRYTDWATGPTVSRCISIKKKTNEIRPMGLGVHNWPACLWLYLCGKWLLRNSARLMKIGHWTILFEGERDTVVLSKAWRHPHFHHVTVWVPVITYFVIRKDFD